jgi:putative ABC transport system permease protein
MNDLKFAFRQLLKNRGFTVIAVSSLAVGLALTASTLAIINAYLLRSLPYPTAHRVYHLRYAPIGPYEPRGMSGIDWKSLEDVVADSITSSGVTFYLKDDVSMARARGLQVSPGFLRGLGVQAMIGRTFAEDEFASGAEGVAVIGHALWRDRFGSDPQVVGRQLRVTREDEQPETLRIVGVLPVGFWFGRDSSATVDVMTPLRTRMRTYMLRLREGVPVWFAEKRITDVAMSVGSDFRPDWTGVHLQSVHDRYVENIRPVLVSITIAVAVVLFLVCVNVALLMLLRAMRRQKEVAVRVALGAKPKHILRMLVAEAGLICGAAFAAGLVLTDMTLRLLVPMIEAQLGKPAPAAPSAIQIDSTVLLALGGVSLLIALSLALIPLLVPWRRRLADTLRSQGTTATDGPFMRRVRSSLIAFEVAGSFVLLVGCGLMIRSAVNLTNTDLGFNPEQVLRVGVRLPARPYTNAPALYRFFTAFTELLPQDTNSRVALMTAFPPFYPANTYRFEAAEARTDETPVGMLKVGAGYFHVYDVPLRQGREFMAADRLGTEPVAVISETLARRLWPDGSVVGRQLRTVEGDMPESPLGPWRTVVGVVGDIRQGYEDSDMRDLYLPFLQSPSRFASVHVRTDRSLSFWEQSVRAATAELEPYAMIGTASTIVSEDRQRAGTRFLTSLLTGFAIFAAFLAVLGIYGVTGYAVQQREREIAVRVAVGASRSAIIRLFLKEGARVLAIGLGLGLLGAFGAMRILENQVYGVQPFDLATRVAACALMATAGLVAVWWPARRAAMRSPMLVLKEG